MPNRELGRRGGPMTRKTLLVIVLVGLASALIGVVPAGAQTCTISGTDGANDLVGTSNRDVICAQGGRDRVVGRGGPDELNGGKGRDTIYAGRGGDNVSGGGGNDVLLGQAGADVIRGGSGADTIIGGDGSDSHLGGDGNDVIDASDDTTDGARGGRGFDTCFVDPFDAVTGCEKVVVS
jgi:Ca2+-binding RTX toxin-like protein